MLIRFLLWCSLKLAIMLNFNISKAAYLLNSAVKNLSVTFSLKCFYK